MKIKKILGKSLTVLAFGYCLVAPVYFCITGNFNALCGIFIGFAVVGLWCSIRTIKDNKAYMKFFNDMTPMLLENKRTFNLVSARIGALEKQVKALTIDFTSPLVPLKNMDSSTRFKEQIAAKKLNAKSEKNNEPKIKNSGRKTIRAGKQAKQR